jgi:sporulation protein YlmC with PRC-barrel domain
MLHPVSKLRGLRLAATDGTLGKVDDVYFDDASWSVRYLVVDTGSWLSDRLVLISPASAGVPDWQGRILPVNLTREQIEKSPDISTDPPVSRQKEDELAMYYGWPIYWLPGGLSDDSSAMLPMAVPFDRDAPVSDAGEQPETPARGDPHLRSAREVMNYRIAAQDGGIGHVEDFLVDDQDWVVRYMVVDTTNWWPGGHVLVSPRWITEIDWTETMVAVNLLRETLRTSPPYDPASPVDRDYEERLFGHCEKPGYWQADDPNRSS